MRYDNNPSISARLARAVSFLVSLGNVFCIDAFLGCLSSSLVPTVLDVLLSFFFRFMIAGLVRVLLFVVWEFSNFQRESGFVLVSFADACC